MWNLILCKKNLWICALWTFDDVFCHAFIIYMYEFDPLHSYYKENAKFYPYIFYVNKI